MARQARGTELPGGHTGKKWAQKFAVISNFGESFIQKPQHCDPPPTSSYGHAHVPHIIAKDCNSHSRTPQYRPQRLKPSAMAPRMLWAAALARRAQHGACERALAPVLTQKRSISRSYLEKVAKAEEEWNQREIEINEGKREHVWDVISSRGLIKDTAPYAIYPLLVPCHVCLTKMGH